MTIRTRPAALHADRPTLRRSSNRAPGRARQAWLAAALTITAVFMGAATGCAGGLRVESQTRNTTLKPNVRLAVYQAEDSNTADIYLTDLSPDEVSGVIPLADASGSILHIRLFVSPRPGRTPIAETAVNATVRLAMLAEGDVGIYGGGGFIFPKGRPGDYTMRIELERASLTLTSSTAGFTDALGASLLDTRVTVRRDEPNAYRLADRFNLALERARGSE